MGEDKNLSVMASVDLEKLFPNKKVMIKHTLILKIDSVSIINECEISDTVALSTKHAQTIACLNNHLFVHILKYAVWSAKINSRMRASFFLFFDL